jgi:hypothetical protein
VDIFAPFTPLEIDRSWRRGIDAFRADWKITDTTSADLVSAWGPTWDTSALGLRLKGYVGPADAEVLLAKRATDVMFGLTTSEAVLGAEVHGEFAVFRTRDDAADIRFFGETNLVPKAVVGVSYNFDIGSGLKTLLEYHYSGFGPQDPSILSARLADPDFLVRWQRGDTQIEGRQAAALQGSYSFDTKWGASLLVLQSLIDSSGVLAPSVSLDLSDNFGLQGTVFLGYGPGSVGSVLQSQFGSVPPTFILKMSIYD